MTTEQEEEERASWRPYQKEREREKNGARCELVVRPHRSLSMERQRYEYASLVRGSLREGGSCLKV